MPIMTEFCNSGSWAGLWKNAVTGFRGRATTLPPSEASSGVVAGGESWLACPSQGKSPNHITKRIPPRQRFLPIFVVILSSLPAYECLGKERSIENPRNHTQVSPGKQWRKFAGARVPLLLPRVLVYSAARKIPHERRVVYGYQTRLGRTFL